MISLMSARKNAGTGWTSKKEQNESENTEINESLAVNSLEYSEKKGAKVI